MSEQNEQGVQGERSEQSEQSECSFLSPQAGDGGAATSPAPGTPDKPMAAWWPLSREEEASSLCVT